VRRKKFGKATEVKEEEFKEKIYTVKDREGGWVYGAIKNPAHALET